MRGWGLDGVKPQQPREKATEILKIKQGRKRLLVQLLQQVISDSAFCGFVVLRYFLCYYQRTISYTKAVAQDGAGTLATTFIQHRRQP